MTDLIGDIHGHADKLKELLEKSGYPKKNDSYAHPDSKVVFVGDYHFQETEGASWETPDKKCYPALWDS